MSWDIDSEGNIVWVEGEPTGGNRVYGIINERTPLGQAILSNRASGRPGLLAPPPAGTPAAEQASAALAGSQYSRPFTDYRQYVPYTDYRQLGGGLIPERMRPSMLSGRVPVDIAFDADGGIGPLFPPGLTPEPAEPSGMPSEGLGGYSPSFVDISAALAMLPMVQTAEEEAAIAATIADLEARAEAGVTAVRSGWDLVRSVNSAAADKARQMAAQAGPEAARLWIDAANTALQYGRQVGDLFTNMAGQQRVNISPTAGVANIAGLMAAQAPRAQAFAERMGLVSADDIASQARTASMMGEAYAGEITRTALQMAQAARDAHNQRVQSRIAANQTQAANLIASAQATNAQIANSAAQFAANQLARGVDASTARQRAIEFDEDVRRYADYTNGVALLSQIYPEVDIATLQAVVNGYRAGGLGSLTARGLAEQGVPPAEALAQSGFGG